MGKRKSSWLGLGWLLVAGICGCGSSSGGSQGGGDVVAGTCGHIDLTGAPVVNLTTGTGTPPTTTGGAIVPGDYVLTSATSYAGTGTPPPWTPEQAVMRIGASALTNDLQAQGAAEIIDGSSYTVSGNAFHYAFTCGAGGATPDPETYTATASTITFSALQTADPSGVGSTIVYLYTLRQ